AAGNQGLYLELLEKFLEDNRDAPHELRESVAAGDLEAAAAIAHAIKGVSGNLGAWELPETCQELETGLTRGDMARVQVAMAQFEPRLQTLFASIQAVIGANAGPTASDAPGPPDDESMDKSALTPVFRELATYLEENNSEASAVVETLQNMLPGGARDEIREMAELIRDWEYEDALDVLKKLADKYVTFGATRKTGQKTSKIG
ncbi:MAG: Hpt domain-containing protein, partial [Desulfobacterales bacterium]|nr:Hpt domain-containing protein [Desulfobacterales bacterium]